MDGKKKSDSTHLSLSLLPRCALLTGLSRHARRARTREHRSGDHGVSGRGFDPIRKSRALLRGWRADFETPASIRITQVGRSPIESEEQRFSFEKIAPAHALLYALRRRRTAPLDVSDASLVVGVGAFRGCQHRVSVADGIGYPTGVRRTRASLVAPCSG